MDHYVTGSAIRALRERRGFTQKQLADAISVSDKAVSKWETQKGLPDITLLEPLSKTLGVSVAELLSGTCVTNRNRSANLLRTVFYVCPVCGNILFSAGEGSFSCCGITLPPLEAEAPEDEHALTVERVENDYYITAGHPMTKDHYLSFFAYVTDQRVHLLRLYPEQDAQGRFPMQGGGILYAYCNRHGLFRIRV